MPRYSRIDVARAKKIFVKAMIEGEEIEYAADLCGRKRDTVLGWLRDDLNLLAEIDEGVNKRNKAAGRILRGRSIKAAATLGRGLDPEPPKCPDCKKVIDKCPHCDSSTGRPLPAKISVMCAREILDRAGHSKYTDRETEFSPLDSMSDGDLDSRTEEDFRGVLAALADSLPDDAAEEFLDAAEAFWFAVERARAAARVSREPRKLV
jgi:hypothetical protein